MHKYLLNLKEREWSILSNLAQSQHRSIAGCLRQLIEDAEQDRLYGKGGMFPDSIKPLPKQSSLLHKRLFHYKHGECEVIEVDPEDGMFKVRYEDPLIEEDEKEEWFILEQLDPRVRKFWEVENA